jgi:hypothetical protein
VPTHELVRHAEGGLGVMCPYCQKADRTRRLHCSGAAVNCWRADCHHAALCEACDRQWEEPCNDRSHRSGVTA